MVLLAVGTTARWAHAAWPIRPAVLLALAGLLACLPVTGRALADILTVHPGQSIGAAIAQARPGDEVRVERGLYRENLLIDKSLTLKGIDRPTLSGGLKGDTVRITAEDVTIDGLIVRDSGDSLVEQNAGIYIRPGANRAIVRNCDLTYNLFGLWIESVRDVQVLNNVITGKRDYRSASRGNGIELYHTEGAQIVGNNISFVRDGIYVDVSNHALFRNNRIHNARYGTHYMNSNDNVWEGNDSYHNRGGLALMMARNQVVRNNRAWGNSDHGIMLRTLQDSVIEGNIVVGNARGFFIYDAEYNTIRNNLVMDNTIGVHLWAGSLPQPGGRQRFHPEPDPDQVRGQPGRDLGAGNYWSNYVGWDRNGDGIGDVPYEANDMVDYLSWRHPMMKLLLASPAVQTLRWSASSSRCCARQASSTPNRGCSRTHPTGDNGVADFPLPTLNDAGAPLIIAHGVRKHYGNIHAVDGVDLDIRSGELFGLIGHNGAGKSTLFKMMLGLIPPTAGDIRIDGALGHRPRFPCRTAHDRLPAGKRRALRQSHRARDAVVLCQAERLPRRATRPRHSNAWALRMRPDGACANTPRACASVSALPRRCSANRASCFSTNPPRAWTRRRSAVFTQRSDSSEAKA